MSFDRIPLRLSRYSATRGYILVIETNRVAMRRLLLRLLETGAGLEGVRDGRTGLAIVKADPGRIELVIVSHRPPRLDALALADRFRRDGFCGRILAVAGLRGSGTALPMTVELGRPKPLRQARRSFGAKTTGDASRLL